MGLIVDTPQYGSGSSNDGNTARKFFENPRLSSELTNIDEDIIKKFGVILETLNCGLLINAEAFDKFSMDTALKYVALYNWYYMPTSVHKVLIHGGAVIRDILHPIGQLSEEAQEAKNKDIKRIREHHTRKCSYAKANSDLFRRLLLSSDPHLSTIAHGQDEKRSVKELDAEVLALLDIPEDRSGNGEETEDDGESSDERETENEDTRY